MKTLEELRTEIDAADADIVAALARRFVASDQIRELKHRAGLPAIDRERERDICERAMAGVPPAHRDTAYSVYERILGGARGMVETIARGVAVMDGKLLLCRAKAGLTTYLPGGHVEFGETGREALAREVREEIGLDVTVGDFLGVVENSFLQHGQPHAEINLTYAMTFKDADTARTLQSREDWIAFEWCPLAALPEARLLPSAYETLRDGISVRFSV